MPNVATAFAFDHTPNPDLYRQGATPVEQGSVVSGSTPRFVLPQGTAVGDRWQLRLPLFYDLEPGEDGVFASALNCGAYGYGKNDSHALESLLDAMVDTFESLEGTPAEQMDRSALRLRELLRGQLVSR